MVSSCSYSLATNITRKSAKFCQSKVKNARYHLFENPRKTLAVSTQRQSFGH